MTRPWARSLRTASLVLLSLAALSLVAGGLSAWRAASSALRIQTIASQAAQTGTVPWSEVRSAAGELRLSLGVLRVVSYPWRPILAGATSLGLVPAGYGQAGPLLDFAAPLAEAGERSVHAAEIVWGALETTGGSGAAEPIATRLSRGLDAAAPQLSSLRAPLSTAAHARTRIAPDTLAGRLASAARALDVYDRTLGSHPAVAELMFDAPAAWRWLIGASEARTFRILGQNHDELRATGGFLATAGEVTVERGLVTRLRQGNPAELDDPRRPPTEPPHPLREFMGLGSWLLQDANWWADFPTAAAQVGAFWQDGPASSGTLAASDGALARLVSSLGPIRLPGLAEPVTAASLPDLIAANIYAGAADHGEGIAIQERKSQFLSLLFSQLLGAALDPPPDRRVALGRAVLDSFAEKHLLLTLADPLWAAALRELRWDGHLDQESSDLIYLVETTVSYTKLAQRMQTELLYSAQLDERASVRRSQLTLRVRNPFSAREVPSMYPSFYFGIWWNPLTRREETHLGRYAGYYRVYVPEGTVLLGGTGWDAPLDYLPRENGRSVVGGYLIVDPGQTREVSLDLIPPETSGAASGIYHLAIPRQPSAPPRNVGVRLTLPAGLSATPPTTSDGRVAPGQPTTRVDDSGRSVLEWRAVSAADLSFVAAVTFTG